MKKIFFIFFLIFSCNKVVKEEVLEIEDFGKLENNGIVVTTINSDLNQFYINFYTEKSEKSKAIIFHPEKNIIIDEKAENNFHSIKIEQYYELTVFQLLSSIELLDKKIVKITIPRKLPYKIAIFGGYSENEESYLKFAKLIGDELPVATIHTGNLIKKPKNKTQWTKFINNSQDFMVNSLFIPALSEKDMMIESIYNLLNYNSKIRSYNYNSMKIITIDEGIDLSKNSTDMKKLEEELSKFSEWKVVVFNRNPFYQDEKYVKEINENLIPILEKNKVALYLTKSRKGYERYIRKTITYVGISINENSLKNIDKKFLVNLEEKANFITCEVTKKRLLFKVYDSSKNVIEEFQIIE